MSELERRVALVEAGKPDVIAERVTRIAADIENLQRDFDESIAGVRRLLFTFFSGLGVAVAAAIVALIVSGGGSP